MFLDTDNKIIPITEFIDAQGLLEHLQKAVNDMDGKSKLVKKAHCGKGASGDKQVHRQEETAEERSTSPRCSCHCS